MYISGENIVVKPYTPVDAYAVMPMAGGIISGGTGGEATVTKGVRFLWTYNPANPAGNPSGFAGSGWFENSVGTPIWYNQYEYKPQLTLETILYEFSQGHRHNLNDVFEHWQIYVAEQAQGNVDVVKEFVMQLMAVSDDACWSFIQG